MIIYYHKMENLINIEMIEENEKMLVGRIFTKLQLGILRKKIQKKSLDINERTYYYKYIKPKVQAMLSFLGVSPVSISGEEHIIKERMPEAVKMLNKFSRKHKNQKIMISGSFLFNEKYNDMDIFVFSRYKKEDYKKGKIHVNFLPESALDSLFFSSLSQISISNFKYTLKTEFAIKLEDILQTYEILINYILNKKEFTQELRKFFLEAEYFSKKVILNPKQLYELRKTATYKNIIKLLSDTLVNSLLYGYPRKKLQDNLKQHIGDYAELLKEYKKAKNLEVYIKTYREAIEVAA